MGGGKKKIKEGILYLFLSSSHIKPIFILSSISYLYTPLPTNGEKNEKERKGRILIIKDIEGQIFQQIIQHINDY